MSEPFTTGLAIGAAGGVASGISKEITQLAWNCGANWIKTRYRDHAPAIIAKVERNSNDFLNKLGLKVTALEQESEITKNLMADAMGEPSFSVLLQKAVLASAQTDNPEKHEIISTIVRDRLKSKSESIYTVTSQMAVDAISNCTRNQIHLLAFATSLTTIAGNSDCIYATMELYTESCEKWFNHRLAPYKDLQVGPLDFPHLQAVSCAQFEGAILREGDLTAILHKNWARGKYAINDGFLFNLPIGRVVRELWVTQRMRSLSLTTIGRLIGTVASDQLCGADSSSFDHWQREGV